MKHKNEHFDLLRKISKNPKVSQRDLAEELELSLGKETKIKLSAPP